MATESAPTTNGVYNGYQAQDTSSVTSGANHSATASQSAAASTPGSKPEALEIGWYFVEQYYTTLSKNPERIHLFYSKKSQMITGKEAEKVLPCVGQKAISEKIKELQLQDCKVRVLNVDSQASFQNIVVQVIGEISNNSNPHEKFAQTFVLAEQPNGYFVLNDIFRYLDMGEEEPAEEQPAHEEPEGQATAVPEAHIESKKSGESVADKAGADVLDAKLEEVAQDEEKAAPAVETDEPETPVEEPEEQPVELPTKTEEPAAQPAMELEKPPAPEPSRAQSPHKEAAPSPAPDAPVKKTWASMVGAKAAAAPAISTPPAASQASAPKATQAPATATPPPGEAVTSSTAAQGNGWQTADHGKKQNRTQPKSDQVVLAYVKGVTEKVDARVLRETLATFGELKYFDVSRPKNCAFVEFATSEGYNAAAAANPHVINGESILVEERRPRSTQFGTSSTGTSGRGGYNAGRGRGGAQGRPGSQSGGFPKDAGRGNFQGRGGSKGGNVTPKGRGQAQAA